MASKTSDVRSRRRRRLALIGAVVLLLVVGAGALFAISLQRQKNMLDDRREQGLKAHLEGRHEQAVTLLEPYLKERTDDKSAWHLYGLSKLAAAKSGNDVRSGIDALQKARTTGPQGARVLRDLLRYSYERYDWPTARSAADDVLREHPEDAEALKIKAITWSKEDPKVAVEAAGKALEANPLEFQVWQVKHQVEVTKLGRPVEEVIAESEALRDGNAQDARAEMVLAHAYALANRREPMVQSLQAAAGKEITDADTALALSRLFEELQLGSEALQVLRDAAGKLKAAPVREELARRLFESGRPSEAITELTSMEQDGESGQGLSASLQGLRAIAEFESKSVGDPAAAAAADKAGRATIQRLSKSKAPEAKEWARVLTAVYVDDITAPGKLAQTIQEARSINRDPYLQFLMGMSYMRSNELEAAKSAWSRSMTVRPQWASPRLRLAQLALVQGQYEEALRQATTAYRLRRDDADIVVTLLQAQVAVLPPGATRLRGELLDNVEELAKALPDDPRVLPLWVRLLAQTGEKDRARAAVREAIQSDRPLSRALLTNLTALSRTHDLGMEDELRTRSVASFGVTPELALGEAVDLAREGKADEGLALIQTQVDAAQSDDRLIWEMVRARFLESVDEGKAHEAWAALTAAHPDELRVQQAALSAPSVRADRAVMDKTIERVRNLSGPEAVEWKIERARWLLSGPEGETQAAQEKALALADAVRQASPGRTEAVLLAATARARLGQSAAAVQLLEEAATQMPTDASIALDLARMYQSQQQYARASERLRKVLVDLPGSPEQKLTAARMLASQGEAAPAAQALEDQRRNAGNVDTQRDTTLAQLHVAGGNLSRARELMEAVVKAEPSAASLLLLANLRLSTGDETGAEALATQIAESDESAAVKHVLLADYYRTRGDGDKVDEHLRAALDEQPHDAMLWKQLVRLHLQQADAKAALETAERAMEVVGQDPGLVALTTHAGAVRRAMAQPPLRPLTEVLLVDDVNREAALEALTLVDKAATSGRPTVQVLGDLRELARRHDEVLGLLALSARADLSYGLNDYAIETAELARGKFPAASTPLELLALARANRGDWGGAVTAAQAWREKLGATPLQADLLIARARLETSDARAALDTLRPYADRATKQPEADADLTALYLRALAATGQNRQVEAVLTPLVGDVDKPLWRMVAMELAATSATDAATAKRWLDLAGEHGTPEERFNLALAWFRAGQRLNAPAMYAEAAQRLATLTASDDANADAWFYQGVIADARGDKATARTSYERAIALFPKLASAKNNLAMLLADDAATQDRAMALAREAVAESGRNPQYLDTLAHVQAKAGKVQEAVATMREVVRAQPEVARWQLNLADLLEQAGKTREAQDIRSRYGEVASAER